MNSKICCWRVVSFGSALTVLSVGRTCVRNSRGPVGRQQLSVHEKSRRSGFLRVCAREDSNLHPAIAGPGPQPGASTNSATGAGGNASLAAGSGTNLPRRARAGLPLELLVRQSRARGEIRARGKSGHRRARVVEATRPGETRGKVPQKRTAQAAGSHVNLVAGKGEKVR